MTLKIAFKKYLLEKTWIGTYKALRRFFARLVQMI